MKCLVAVTVAALAVCSTAAASDWQALDATWSIGRDAFDTWHVGGSQANPVATLPIDAVRGRWVRTSVTEALPTTGVHVRLSASRNGRIVASSAPSLCDMEPVERRCAATMWIPDDATAARVAVYATLDAGDVRAPEVVVATVDASSASVADRATALVETLERRYYRTDEVDWQIERRLLRAIPTPPNDFDPLPAIAQMLRDRLPGNRHLFVVTKAATTSSVATMTTPTCDVGARSPATVTLPGIMAVDDEGPAPMRTRCTIA